MDAIWSPCFEDLLYYDELEFVKLSDFKLDSLSSFVVEIPIVKDDDEEQQNERKDREQESDRASECSSDQSVHNYVTPGPSSQRVTDPPPSRPSEVRPLQKKPYMCHICGKQYAKSRSLTNHMFIHTGRNPHECDVCNETFRNFSKLAAHKKTHRGVRRRVWRAGMVYEENVFSLQS